MLNPYLSTLLHSENYVFFFLQKSSQGLSQTQSLVVIW